MGGGALVHHQEYVDRLKAAGHLPDPGIERAFRRVPRHLFVERFFVGSEADGWTPSDHDPAEPEPDHLATIYSDAALIIRLVDNRGTSSTSQPSLVAQMLHLLELRPGARVLEIGAGTGYNAALIAAIVGDPSLVTALDIQEDVVAQARRSLARAGFGGLAVRCRDGALGAPESAPFDRIVATVGSPNLSPAWVDQLAADGFMLIPLRHASGNPLVRLGAETGSGDPVGAVVGFSGFMGIQGSLHDQRYYPPAAPPTPDDAEERPAWPDLRDEPARLGFWFYLGLSDPRVRLFRWFDFGLHDPVDGRTARVDRDRLVGDPSLLDDLEERHGEWLALGLPELRRFRLRFTRRDDADAQADPTATYTRDRGASEPTWSKPGRYYHRIVTVSAS
jgi:protein-L-isoaspartate(D-aspartate) O-methyltransferase